MFEEFISDMDISNLLTHGSNIDLVTNKIMNADDECKNYGIKNIFVSGLTLFVSFGFDLRCE